MSYDGQVYTLTAGGMDFTGDKEPGVAASTHRFVAPFDCFIDTVDLLVTTAVTDTEVISIRIGTAADPNAYSTSSYTGDGAATGPVATTDVFVTEGDNPDSSAIRTRITKGTEIAIAAGNDGAAVAGVGNATVTIRALNTNV